MVIALLVGGLSGSKGAEWISEGPLETSEGVVTLAWESGGDQIELRQIGPDGSQVVREISGDRKTVVSGLSNGRYEFSLREPDGEWGEILVVESSYMERGQVIRLLLWGGAVVAGIVAAILWGSFAWRKEGKR